MPFVKVPPWIQWNLKVARGLACLLVLEEIVQQLRQAKRCKYWINNIGTITVPSTATGFRSSTVSKKHKQYATGLLINHDQPVSCCWLFSFFQLVVLPKPKLPMHQNYGQVGSTSQVFCHSAPPAASAHLRWTRWESRSWNVPTKRCCF